MNACENLVIITEADLISGFIVVQARHGGVFTRRQVDQWLENQDHWSGSLNPIRCESYKTRKETAKESRHAWVFIAPVA